MLSKSSTEQQAAPIHDAKVRKAKGPAPLNPRSKIEVASGGGGTVTDPPPPDNKPPGVCDPERHV